MDPPHFSMSHSHPFPSLSFLTSCAFLFFFPGCHAVPPKELSVVDPNGHRVGRVAGPYDEGSDLIIFCRAFGKHSLYRRYAFLSIYPLLLSSLPCHRL